MSSNLKCPFCNNKCLSFWKKLLMSPLSKTKCNSCDKYVRVSSAAVVRNILLIFFVWWLSWYYQSWIATAIIGVGLFILTELFITIQPAYRKDLDNIGNNKSADKNTSTY
jgi:hypothetical protein